MNREDMPLIEQLSEVSGDVKRCIDSRETFLAHNTLKDNSLFYYNKAQKLILNLNLGEKEYRRKEFIDELAELQEYLSGHSSITAAYIMSYWKQFENAV